MNNYQKKLVSIRYWLLGRKAFTALNALEFAQKYHVNFRKDGVTPEFQHQIEIAHYVRTLEGSLIDLDSTITTVFLHDVCEDYDVEYIVIENKFGLVVRNAVEKMTKKYKGVKLPTDVYYSNMSICPIASIAKGGDRGHNIGSMVGVFTHNGQKHYIEETENYVLPMLKKARRMFPEQEAAYENIKHILTGQLHLIKKIHEAENKKND